ncbi:putative Histidine kinase [Planktothrix serta PCC 8927]|uniref:Circadian input-output histidine kinase CikA n=1 Tax=Planktothrix serta PCC 8927 TaxID=671068 RepID=A0A7Z9BGN6_9CYAN|nr:PAS domain S-box protein [Planktothrix serta]VXD12987.1 putative Histidine kinase [Planktothrix serta PCC 8927]
MNTDFTNSLPQWLRFIQRHRASLIIGIPISSLTIGLVIIATFQYQTQEARNRVRHTYLVHNQAQDLLVQVLTTEISVKDYALTRQKKYLNTYQKVDQSLPISLQKLQDLVVDNPRQTQQTQRIESAINQSQKLLKNYLSTLQTSSLRPKELATLQNIFLQAGIQMQITRKEISQFIQEEERLLEERRLVQNQQIQLTWISMFAVTGLGIVGSIFAICLMQKLDQKLALQIAQTHAQERLFRDTFEQAAVGIGHVSLSGRWLKVNQKFCEIVGYSRDELLRSRLSDLTHPNDIDADLYLFQKLINQQIPSYSIAKRYLRKNGSIVWINLTVSLGSWLDKSPYWQGEEKRYGISVIEDITARKELELERDRFFELSVDILIIANRNRQLKRVSPSVEKILGFTPQELHQTSFISLVYPDDLSFVEATISDENTQEALIVSFETRLRCKDNTYKWIAWNCVRVASSGLMYGTGRDITERKQVEDAIERERQQLRQIITHAPVAMAMFDREMCYIAYSDKWLSDFGLVGLNQQSPSIKQQGLEAFPQMPDAWKNAFKQVLKGKIISSPEDVFYDADGKKSMIRWAIHPWYEPNQQIGGVVIAADRIDELVEAREAALENARIKSQFLANMSHEIRTPMNGVMGMAGLLLKTELTSKQQDFVQGIRISAEHLLAIINDILDFSKLEAGEMKLESLDFDLENCLETVIDLVATQAEEKGLELAMIMDIEVPRQLRGDPGRLRQVLLNLLGNGIKFTATGEVVVRVNQLSSTSKMTLLRFEVSDTGIGISPEGQAQLFQCFSQLDSSTTRQYGGTGLGLVISKQLVNLMGGEIGVTSQLGQGSKFWFTAQFLTGEASKNRLVPPSLMNLKLLVVDSSATIRQAICYLTQSWGMQLDEATDGESALTLLHQATTQGEPYHAAIFDQQLLRSNGDNMAEVIRGDRNLSQTKLVLMTMMNQRDLAEQMLQQGVASYLIKPVRASRLFDALLTAMANQISSSLQQQRQTAASKHQEIKTQPKPPLKILLAEDHPINQQVILNQLSLLGYEADLANNGQEALEILAQKNYDVIFMDCQMPLLDGYATTQQLRQQENEDHHTIIIALTAHALPTDREKCLAAGMDDYLSKPVEPEELEAVLEKWSKVIQYKNQKSKILGTTGLTKAKIPSVSADQTPLNIERLQAISGGKKDFQQKLLRVYLDRTDQDFSQIRQAIADQDFVSLQQYAHRLKGSSANVGATIISQLAYQLENATQQQNISLCSQLVTNIEHNLETLKTYIEQYLHQI